MLIGIMRVGGRCLLSGAVVTTAFATFVQNGWALIVKSHGLVSNDSEKARINVDRFWLGAMCRLV